MGYGKYILNAQGEPEEEKNLITWARWFENANDERRVAETTIAPGGTRVSTVFLGLDHSFGEPGLPVLWETMIFGGLLDGETDRYTSRAAAETGHAAMVARAQAAAR